MADYNSMKVPELKKLLTERGLPHTGNKADLIARLNENDKQKATASEPQAGKLLSFLDRPTPQGTGIARGSCGGLLATLRVHSTYQDPLPGDHGHPC
jgi:hypothetical protein